MLAHNRVRRWLLTAGLAIGAQFFHMSLARAQPVSIIIVRHAEAVISEATIPLSTVGRQRAELLAQTVRGVRFTHVFASHTTRARQMVEAIASTHGLAVTQLPAPDTMLDGQLVTDQTSRAAAVQPISDALLRLPPGSTAIAALNSENIFAIINRLGVPAAPAGQPCSPGSVCVPCTNNSCYPRSEYDHLWHLVREPGRAEPVAFIELRYGVGWRPSER